MNVYLICYIMDVLRPDVSCNSNAITERLVAFKLVRFGVL